MSNDASARETAFCVVKHVATTRRVVSSAIVILIVLSRWAAVGAAEPKVIFGRVMEDSLRRIAEHVVVPVFPPEAAARKEAGVAVAEISIAPNGSVTSVDVLDAPSSSIGAAVSRALQQWRFRPITDGRPLHRIGKIIYYFVFQEGRPAVLPPERAPYIGRWPRGRS